MYKVQSSISHIYRDWIQIEILQTVQRVNEYVYLRILRRLKTLRTVGAIKTASLYFAKFTFSEIVYCALFVSPCFPSCSITIGFAFQYHAEQSVYCECTPQSLLPIIFFFQVFTGLITVVNFPVHHSPGQNIHNRFGRATLFLLHLQVKKIATLSDCLTIISIIFVSF